MKTSTARWFGRSSLVVAAALANACSDGAPVAPVDASARPVAAVADVSDGNRLPDLPAGCERLPAPVGSTVVLRAFGVGVQVYRWDGVSWRFVNPSATLYAEAEGRGKVADHFGGPTWKSNSGGSVVGTVADGCTPDAASIPWLSLTALADSPGVFQDVKFIQRLNTVGGNAPSAPGSVVGQRAEVPYTADYLFYQTP